MRHAIGPTLLILTSGQLHVAAMYGTILLALKPLGPAARTLAKIMEGIVGVFAGFWLRPKLSGGSGSKSLGSRPCSFSRTRSAPAKSRSSASSSARQACASEMTFCCRSRSTVMCPRRALIRSRSFGMLRVIYDPEHACKEIFWGQHASLAGYGLAAIYRIDNVTCVKGIIP